MYVCIIYVYYFLMGKNGAAYLKEETNTRAQHTDTLEKERESDNPDNALL